jgi:hypothetical protein
MAIQIVSRRRRWNLYVLVSLLWTTQIAGYGVDQGSSRPRSGNLRGKATQQTENSVSSIPVDQQDRPKSHDLSDLNSSWAQQQQQPVDDEQQHVSLSRSRHRGLGGQSYEKFVTNCVGHMLSGKAINDNDHISSQNDLASFVRQQCVWAGNCDSSESLPFESLSVKMQLSFVWAVCGESDPYDRAKCLRHVLKAKGQYGFHIHHWDENHISYYRPIIKDMCGEVWSEAIDLGLIDGIRGEIRLYHIIERVNT